MLATEIPPPLQPLVGICAPLWMRTFWFYFGRTDIPASFASGSNLMPKRTMCGCRDLRIEVSNPMVSWHKQKRGYASFCMKPAVSAFRTILGAVRRNA